MKKYESIMKRVRFIEEKYGIKYAKTDGKLFNSLKWIHIIAFAYTMGINLLYIAGMCLMYSDNEVFAELKPQLITVCSCSAGLILGLVLLCTKLKAVGAAVSIASLPFMVLQFAVSLKDDLGFLGYKISFYWRHFAPALIMAIMLIGMLIIAVRAAYKTDKQYKKIISNLYSSYNNAMNTGDNAGITDEQWDEFLRSYDPRDKGYKNVITSSETADEHIETTAEANK